MVSWFHGFVGARVVVLLLTSVGAISTSYQGMLFGGESFGYLEMHRYIV